MYNVIHDSKEESIRQLAAEIDQINRAMDLVPKFGTCYTALELDMDKKLKKYWKLTGHYFFIPFKQGQAPSL